jgi:DNA polymerase-3 subunit epsilon
LRDKGRNYNEQSCLLVENGRFYGMGYIPNDFEADSFEALKAHLSPYPDNGYIRNLVLSHAEQVPAKDPNISLNT